jgi:phage terminase large subunit-like protein
LTLDDIPEGTPCYMGVDLASTNDLTSVALVFGNYNSGLVCFSFNWCPQDTCKRREKLNKGRFWTWAQEGHLAMTPGGAVDPQYVEDFIVEQYGRFNVRKLFMDPALAHWLQIRLHDRGVLVESLRQGPYSLGHPTAELERLTLAGKVMHHDNPVLNWCMGNAVVKTDAIGNKRIDRGGTREKIDAVAALIDAVAAMISDSCRPAEPVPAVHVV